MPHESADAAVRDGHPDSGAQPARKRRRPLTAAQEALFFGVTFTVAVVLQLAVILKVANVAW
jgi:hypothetical protein